MRYSDDTLDRFGKYMLAELNAVIQYYSEDNIRRIVKTCPEARIENYHGDVKNGRMDFSGNGGKFRYFYDILGFSDDSRNGTGYNLNQRLQYLFELQKKIEAGQVVDISADDPMYQYVGTISVIDKDKLDGFELVRQEL